MIGSAELSIDGITQDGKREPVFRNGNWAIVEKNSLIVQLLSKDKSIVVLCS
ncbi:hypothetical protein GCM10020331_021220 [Ectobacillus funiculus]